MIFVMSSELMPSIRRLSSLFGVSRNSSPVKGEETPQTPQPLQAEEKWVLEERSIDECRPLRIIVMGAGISGILATIRLTQRITNLDLCVYEKNADIGGTWYENRYPGCACGMFYSLS